MLSPVYENVLNSQILLSRLKTVIYLAVEIHFTAVKKDMFAVLGKAPSYQKYPKIIFSSFNASFL
jgi:hypothetical protein